MSSFDTFDSSQKKKDESLQVLADYEKHYMELLKEHKTECKEPACHECINP